MLTTNKYKKIISIFFGILSLGLVLSACGSNDSKNEVQEPKTVVPTAQEIKALINKAMDPNVKSSEKIKLVQDAAKDPSIFDKLQEYKKANPKLDFEIGVVTPTSDNNAKFQVTAYPKGMDAVDEALGPFGVVLLQEDGNWKLAKKMVCQIFQSAEPKISSPICA